MRRARDLDVVRGPRPAPADKDRSAWWTLSQASEIIPRLSVSSVEPLYFSEVLTQFTHVLFLLRASDARTQSHFTPAVASAVAAGTIFHRTELLSDAALHTLACTGTGTCTGICTGTASNSESESESERGAAGAKEGGRGRVCKHSGIVAVEDWIVAALAFESNNVLVASCDCGEDAAAVVCSFLQTHRGYTGPVAKRRVQSRRPLWHSSL